MLPTGTGAQQTLPLAPVRSPSSKYLALNCAGWNGTGHEQDWHGHPLATASVLRPRTYQAFHGLPVELLSVPYWDFCFPGTFISVSEFPTPRIAVRPSLLLFKFNSVVPLSSA